MQEIAKWSIGKVKNEHKRIEQLKAELEEEYRQECIYYTLAIVNLQRHCPHPYASLDQYVNNYTKCTLCGKTLVKGD